jgi:hypothetical protein
MKEAEEKKAKEEKHKATDDVERLHKKIKNLNMMGPARHLFLTCEETGLPDSET